MVTEIGYIPTPNDMTMHDFHHPIFQGSTIPLADSTECEPQKTLREAAKTLSLVDTDQCMPLHPDHALSARSLTGGFPQAALDGQPSHQRASSLPPRETAEKKRRKRAKKSPQGDPFIQEAFSFPKQQTWLEIKSRQRRVAVEVEEDTPAEGLLSQAPQDGEALYLDRHADRIAALIAQKRKENELKMFRERMSLQQRLHRGEPDDKGRHIAFSHDELKRKMELSARGIFEEQPPNGGEPAFALKTPSSPSAGVKIGGHSLHQSMVPANAAHAQPENGSQNSPLQRHRSGSFEYVEEPPSNGKDGDLQSADNASNSLKASSLAHLGQTAFYQAQTTTSTQTLAFSHAPSQPITMHHCFTQPRFTHQRHHNAHLWQPESQGRADQAWTSHAMQALPSTSTPPPNAPTNSQLTRDFPQATHIRASPPAAGDSPTTTSDQRASALLDRLAASRLDSPPPVLRSNMNMFTRQARENGVIGGNNNYFGLSGEAGRRRNMFDSRS